MHDIVELLHTPTELDQSHMHFKPLLHSTIQCNTPTQESLSRGAGVLTYHYTLA